MQMTWTDERIETLKRLYKEGLSAGIIAMRLGHTTRNAVIGKIHRLGLPTHGQPKTLLSDICKAARRLAVAVANKPSPSSRPKVSPLASLPITPLPVEDTPSGPLVMFADLEAHHCRAPYGDPKQPGFGFCGCKNVPGTSYCEDHHRRFFTAPRCRQPYTPGVPRQIHAVNSQVTPTEREDVFA